MADINVRSIKLVEVATKTPDPIIQGEVVCDDGTTTSQSSPDC